jgi:hypothetical protein
MVCGVFLITFVSCRVVVRWCVRVCVAGGGDGIVPAKPTESGGRGEREGRILKDWD